MKNKLKREHYDFLVKCAEGNNIEAWNAWHDEQRAKDKNFKLYLKEAKLEKADLSGANLECADLCGAKLGNADLLGTHLECADLSGAHLENTILTIAHLENANLTEANMENAYLMGAHMENARLEGSHIENAYLEGAHLENAILRNTHLDNTDLSYSYLNNTELINISFTNKKGELIPFKCKGALFRNIVFSIREGHTKKEEKEIIKAMSQAQLNNISFPDPVFGRKVRDEAWLYNWKQQNSRGINKVKKFFWGITCDYGRNIWQWAFMSLLISILFGIIILLGQDSFLFETANEQLAHWYNAFYYSIVTFTTLGFGVLSPRLTSIWAQIVITIEVILGYIMLGCLVSILINKLARRND